MLGDPTENLSRSSLAVAWAISMIADAGSTLASSIAPENTHSIALPASRLLNMRRLVIRFARPEIYTGAARVRAIGVCA